MNRMKKAILGAGMTGLSAGLASGLPVYEATEVPGGVCCSYYMRPGDKERIHAANMDTAAYRFEQGGGHWIFGGDPMVLRSIRSVTPVRSYARRSSVYFPAKGLFVPYPVQNHLRYFEQQLASKALREVVQAATVNHRVTTMADWLRASFGSTLCELFFEPFHELYTAGLWKSIRPQDDYKSPVNLSLAIQGALDQAPSVGYNVTFIYPTEGLGTLAQRMAERCKVYYRKLAVRIDVARKEVDFADGSGLRYETLISTLPLNRVAELTGLEVDAKPDPCTSVLVINVGAVKGRRCPLDHWVYIPKSKAGFHRVGFYSNVDPSFLPACADPSQERMGIYVEKAYAEGQRPSEAEVQALCSDVVQELHEWGWIEGVEVVDPTWIDVAYTWSWPGSRWKQEMLKVLEQHDVCQVGRYARWAFQGIADSIRDGFVAGSTVR